MKKQFKKTDSVVLSVHSILLVYILCGCSESTSDDTTPEAVTESLILVNGTMIDGTGDEPIQDAMIVVRGDRIVAAGRAESMAAPENARVVDLHGATILPGFINTHVHFAYDAETLQAFAQAGVTTVRDMQDSERMDWQWFERRDELLKDPLNARLLAVGPMVTVPGGYPIVFEEKALIITSSEQARTDIQALIDAGADAIKIAVETGTAYFMEKKMPTLSLEEVEAIVSVAHPSDIKVVSHITHSQDIPIFLDGGGDEIGHMVVDDELSDDLIEQIVAADIYWGPTLELWYLVQQVYEQQFEGFRYYSNAIANLKRFVEAGGKAVLGTDFGGFPGNEFQMGMPMIEIESMLKADMTPMQVIVAATRDAAHACNREKDLGTLEKDKIADILVVEGNPLEDIQALNRPVLVVHNGTVIRNEL
jgi:imidazolonepropionase-like amidohydrolase